MGINEALANIKLLEKPSEKWIVPKDFYSILIDDDDFREVDSSLISHLNDNEFAVLRKKGKTKRKIVATLGMIAFFEQDNEQARPYDSIVTPVSSGGWEHHFYKVYSTQLSTSSSEKIDGQSTVIGKKTPWEVHIWSS